MVSIYNTQATGGIVFKTTLAAYAGATPPADGDDAARKSCLKGTNSSGTAALTGSTSFASLDGTRAVTIAPGDTVTVYLAAQGNYDASNPTLTTGKVNLVVKTEQLN